MSLLLLCACGPLNARGARRPITLTFATWGSTEEMATLRPLLAEFEAAHPGIRLKLLHIPANYFQKLHILVAGGMMPDVVFVNNLSFPVYAAHGLFEDLDPWLARDPGLGRADFFGPALEAFSWRKARGKALLGAIPRDVSNLVVFYNRDWFARAGLPPPPEDWTWPAFLHTARRLTLEARGNAKGGARPQRFGVSFYKAPPLFWLPFVLSAGGELFSDDLTRLRLAEAPALEGLGFYADLRNRYHVAPRAEDTGDATMSQLFLQEKVAMMVSGRWSVPVLREQARFAWDVVPFPRGKAGSRVGIDASGYAMAAASRHKREAWALIAFLSSRKAQARFARSGLIVPARRDVAESPAFLDPQNPPAHGRVFLEVLATGVPTRTPPRWNEISEELLLALDPVWEGRLSPQEALAPVLPRVNRLLESSDGGGDG